ncbi:MAG: hypothetical protein LBL21_01930 [Rickettsiales bacterium]|jgi:inorganic pyrophosphatase/manganese-dependent inorganic pyrophosphatase|nr:hypothetical protein [Rickettsiales bacterium]
MNDKLCVFSTYPYTDIDALACAVAYAELNDCAAFLPGPMNATIPESVRRWDFEYSADFPAAAERFVMVDFSDPAFITPRIPVEKIIKVYDHHTGFEDYWGPRGRIEFIGACATMIYELFGERAPGPTTANLLMTAIFSNTLGFCSSITTDRDRDAYEKLRRFATLPDDWIERYYSETEKCILGDMGGTIKNDLKIMDGGSLTVGQLELWDAKALLNDSKFMTVLESVMSGYDRWLMTMPSISEGKNYLITNDTDLKKALSEKFGAKWSGRVGYTPAVCLRKEFRKAFNWK